MIFFLKGSCKTLTFEDKAPDEHLVFHQSITMVQTLLDGNGPWSIGQ